MCLTDALIARRALPKRYMLLLYSYADPYVIMHAQGLSQWTEILITIMNWTPKYKHQLQGPYKVYEVVCQNSAVSNIMHLRVKQTYTKFVWLYHKQGGGGAPAAQRARYGPVPVLRTVQVQVLYEYFRVPVPYSTSKSNVQAPWALGPPHLS